MVIPKVSSGALVTYGRGEPRGAPPLHCEYIWLHFLVERQLEFRSSTLINST